MFRIVEHHELLMNFDRFNSLYKTSQVCPIVVLRLLQEGKTKKAATYFIVGSAHISYNVERGDKKLAQVLLITDAMHQIEKYLTQLGNKTVCILCGDFNSTPSSAVFKLLTRGSYDCKTLPLINISGQIDTIMPEKTPISESWYKETINKCSHWSDKTLQGVERLPLWYMTIKNTYVEYDIIKRSLIAKYKVELPLIYSFYERKSALSPVEKRRIREAFCDTMDEVEKLDTSEELLDYVLESPITFKNAYSEVFKGVIDYIKCHMKKGRREEGVSKTSYKPIGDSESLKEAIGTKFNDVELNYDNWEETEKALAGHTYESGYSHWVDRVLKCDYIFYKGEGMVAKKIYKIPDFKDVVELGNICPNECVPSDHLPVAAVFYYSGT